jgi:hypothetical protein
MAHPVLAGPLVPALGRGWRLLRVLGFLASSLAFAGWPASAPTARDLRRLDHRIERLERAGLERHRLLGRRRLQDTHLPQAPPLAPVG